MSDLLFLPEAFFNNKTEPASKSSLGATTNKEPKELTVAAENEPLRLTYGRDNVSGQIANVINDNRRWVVQVVWGEGQIQEIESVAFANEPASENVEMTHYLGTQSQTVDPWLVTAFAAAGITYSDALPGIAYSVFRILEGEVNWENATAIIKGRLLYDPRTMTTAYSNNFALALADFLSNDVYGCGLVVDWDSVIDVANYCDELIDGKPRRCAGLTLSTITSVDNWVETMRTYAGCFAPVLGPNGWKLIADKPSSVVASFSHTLGNIEKIGVLRKKGLSDSPTLIRLFWTDTSSLPWKEVPVLAALPGVLEGTAPRRDSDIRLPGIQDVSQAVREARERLNKLTLNDLSFDMNVFDEGLSLEIGDVIDVSHPIGLSSKQMRVSDIRGSSGRHTLSLAEYQPSMYSNAVVTTPDFGDTSLPSAFAPTPPLNLSLSEQVFQQNNGTFTSQIVASWDATAFPFVSHYIITVYEGPALFFTGTSQINSFRTPPIKEGASYQVDVATVSYFNQQSAPISDTIVSLGKFLPPSDVPSLDGFEVGGEVRLRWQAAVDIDIWRYEIRYGLVGGTWANGVLIDRVDALTLVTTIVPEGEWDFMIKALDSVNNFSVNEARITISVTKDDASFLAGNYQYDTPSLTAMYEYSLGRLDTVRRFVSTSNLAWNTAFSSAMSGYGNAILTYFPATSEFLTESNDFGFALAGNWSSDTTTMALSGTFTDQMELSTDGSTWENFPLMTTKGLYRFSRVRLNSSGVMLVTMPGVSTNINAQPRIENGSITTASSGATTITLINEYSAIKTLTLTPTGSTSRSAVADNIVTGATSSFDVYLFDSSGNQVSGEVYWVFEGV